MSEIVSGHPYTDIHALWDRCERIEARQRAYGMHDPNCTRFLSETAKMGEAWFGIPTDCTCWLSKAD